MNTVIQDTLTSQPTESLQLVVNQEVMQCVNEVIDRGITRIKRGNLVEKLIKVITGYADLTSSLVPAGKVVVLDTVAARFTIAFKGNKKFTITIEGNDELSSKLVLVGANNCISLNGNGVEFTSLVVMVTSLLLKNSQDSGGQYVEVFTKS